MKFIFLSAKIIIFFLFLSMTVHASSYEGKKILYIDSYHDGYAWSDGITAGIKSVIEPSNAQLKIIRLDTKRNGSEEFKKEAALSAKAVIEEFKPDVVIASDDNASKYLIVPYYKDADLPFVYCGVNWDASVYGFPTSNVTGMTEVDNFKALMNLFSKFTAGTRVGFIADDTETTRKVVKYAESIFNLNIIPYYATDMAKWKEGYTFLQENADVLIFYSFAGINDWNKQEALGHIIHNTKIPSASFQQEVSPYVLLGLLKIPEEQGEWSAKAALKILDGTSCNKISSTKNRKGKLVVNASLAKKVGIDVPYKILKSAGKVVE